ncbi:tetratricopeptide repeat protein [Indioceanicola profundi]|uniref:hypothetical protein n=1 Tax=Indioceanicola profundi TaxID=2220096 RepID=UPI000E6AA1AC|nr:hypothetical protein [Indioceanicola profundi]
MTHMLNRSAMLAALALALGPAALAPRSADAAIFESRSACLEKVEEAPDFALVDAQAWERQGGGIDARLCQALAQLTRGEWDAAGTALEKSIAELKGEPPEVLANLWTRAGLAWSEAGKADKAEAAYAKAIKLRPQDPQMLIDRALARADQERWWEVVEDLDAAIELAPKNREALLLRADAQARLARGREALMDVDAVLAEDGSNPDALLLRGELLADREDYAGARSDWRRVLEAAPDSGAAEQARRNLEALDAFAKAQAQ